MIQISFFIDRVILSSFYKRFGFFVTFYKGKLIYLQIQESTVSEFFELILNIKSAYFIIIKIIEKILRIYEYKATYLLTYCIKSYTVV